MKTSEFPSVIEARKFASRHLAYHRKMMGRPERDDSMEGLLAQAAKLREKAADLEKEAKLLIIEAQKKCKHLRVVESESYANEFGLYVQQKRKCIDCGLRETSSYGRYKSSLKDADFIKKVRWTEI